MARVPTHYWMGTDANEQMKRAPKRMKTLEDCIFAVAKDYRENEMKFEGPLEAEDFMWSSVPKLCALWEYGKSLQDQPQAVIDLLYSCCGKE
jgi:hypothetical protein